MENYKFRLAKIKMALLMQLIVSKLYKTLHIAHFYNPIDLLLLLFALFKFYLYEKLIYRFRYLKFMRHILKHSHRLHVCSG
jgi:hypothetical protein